MKISFFIFIFAFVNQNTFCEQSRHPRWIENLNPVKIVTYGIRGIVDLFGLKNKGIWIGLRHTCSKWKPFGIQIIPGIDMYHYAVRIRGIIYYITSASEFDIIKVLVDDRMSEDSFR
jgi:hypothetical protein